MTPATLFLAPSSPKEVTVLVPANKRGDVRGRMRGDDVAEWVVAARGGDRTSHASLYARFARAVHAVVLARAPASEVDDAVQDTFIAAFRALDTLTEPAAFGGWILQIARRTAIDHRRRARSSVELTDDAALTTSPPRAEAREALRVLTELPEAYRETLVMRLVEGMSGPEIADATGLTPESVRVNLCRGMKLLRDRLGSEERP